MKKLAGQNVLAMIPTYKGAFFLERKTRIDGKNSIVFSLYDFTDHSLKKSDKNTFLAYKIGVAFDKIVKEITFAEALLCKSVMLPEDLVLTIHKGGAARIFDESGRVIRELMIRYGEEEPGDIIFFDGWVWACYPQANVIVKYHPETLSQKFRYGGGETLAFFRPVSICGYNGELYVINAQGDVISVFNINTYSLHDYAGFREPLYRYIKHSGGELVHIKSGVYRF